MSKDIVPVIYTLRSKVNESRSLEEQADIITESLLHLDRIYGDYDNIDIVKEAKQMLTQHFLHNTSDVNIKSHLQLKGFEPIKKQIIATLVPTQAIEGDLLCYKYASCSNKKQKCGDYGVSFNFDDLPAFESIDGILADIRSSNTNPEPLMKLLALDLSELVEHPIWEEILNEMSQILSTSENVQTISHVFSILHRFIVGFKGTGQGLDSMIHTLRYLINQWVLKDPQVAAKTNIFAKQQLALFCSVLAMSAQGMQVPYQRDVDKTIASIFLILAKGQVQHTLASTGAPEVCTVMEALAFTADVGSSISALLQYVHPFSALSYATQTGLLSVLMRGSAAVDHNIVSTSKQQQQQQSCWQLLQQTKVSTFQLRILLLLITNCGHNALSVLNFIEENATSSAPGEITGDLTKYEWAGDVHAFCTVTASSRDKADTLQPVGDSNKRFLHLAPCEPLPQIFHESHGGISSTASSRGVYVLQLVLARLNHLHSFCEALVAGESPTSRDADIASVLHLTLQLVACVDPAHYSDAIGAVCKACQDILHLLLATKTATGVPAVGLLFASRNRLLDAIIAGVHAILSSAHGAEFLPAVQPLLHFLMGLDLLLAPKNSSSSVGVVESYLRLLDVFVSIANTVTQECDTISAIVAACVEQLETIIRKALVEENSRPISANFSHVGRLVQVLQTACLQPMAPSAMTSVTGSDAAVVVNCLLTVLLNPRLLPPTSCSCSRTAASLLKIFLSWSGAAVQIYFASESPILRSVLEVLRAEYEDPGTFERAYDCETSSASGGFSALFPLLLGLARAGHAEVLCGLLRRSWGDQIEFSLSNAFSGDLAKLTALLVIQGVAADLPLCVYESECVYPYVLRFLHAALHDVHFCDAVRAHCVQESASAGQQGTFSVLRNPAQGVGLTDMFTQAARAMINHNPIDYTTEPPLGDFFASDEYVKFASK